MQCRDGYAFVGVLTYLGVDALELRDVARVDANPERPDKLAGEVWLLRENVSYFQAMPLQGA